MSRRKDLLKDEEEGGLSGEALVGTCFNAFASARRGSGVETPAFEDLPGLLQGAFAAAVREAEGALNRVSDEDTRLAWSTLGDACLCAYLNAAGEPAESGTFERKHLLTFEAMARHCANAMDWDKEDGDEGLDLESFEGHWEGWVKERLGAVDEEPGHEAGGGEAEAGDRQVDGPEGAPGAAVAAG